MAKKLVPSQFRTHLIDQLLESIDETANSTYYAFVGDHITTGATEQEVDQPRQSYKDTHIDVYRDMIFGKKFTSKDFRLMIPKHEWETGTVYAAYDDQDPELFNKAFYVMVDEAAFIHVYKCLSNNNGQPSTVPPLFADVQYDEALFDTGDAFYETSDGYQWKYMYSIDSVTFNEFATDDYIPFVANTVTQDDALDGSIDVIKVDDPGKDYNNHVSSQFSGSDVSVGSSLQFRLPDTASPVENFYANTILHLTSGAGAGQYRRVVSSNNTVIGDRVFIEVEDAFQVSPDGTTKYQISPEVRVIGDGSQTSNTVARAVINANASNSVSKVEILDVGENYHYATAKVLQGVPADKNNIDAGELITPTPASVRPIVAPPFGHGSNPARELGGRALCMRMEFNQSEANTIPAENSFSQFGIIRDPHFANVEITHTKLSDGTAGADGNFVVGERFITFNKHRLYGSVTIAESNNIIESEASDARYDEELSPGDIVYTTNPSTAGQNFVSTIDAVVNSTAIRVDSLAPFSQVGNALYLVSDVVGGTINNIDSSRTEFNASDVDGAIRSGTLIVGMESFTTANVEYINVNNRLPDTGVFDFNTFNQTTKCVGAISGSFQNNEMVYQGDKTNPSMTAYVHSSTTNELFLTRVNGNVDTTKTILGELSDASMSSFTKYYGELDQTSGTVIYIQNDVPISRTQNQSESIRAILEF